MKVIRARNVNDALPQAIDILLHHGHKRDSRNGPVYVYDTPVTTQYQLPRERVLLWSARDANPFFHLYEALYMLSGEARVAPLKWFVKRMETFSDNGSTFHGFYGHRWRNAFGKDQLDIILQRLRANPDDRRINLQMWSCDRDLDVNSRDIPCNTNVYFAVNVHGALDMTVCNRSNDVVWGAYGANVVHMSVLQEYMAGQLGIPVGRYWQMSNNFHGYEDTLLPLADADRTELEPLNPYVGLSGGPISMYHPDEDVETLTEDIFILASNKPQDFEMGEGLRMLNSFFVSTVMLPMIVAYKAHKARDYKEALSLCKLITSEDWRVACTRWMEKRRAVHQGG